MRASTPTDRRIFCAFSLFRQEQAPALQASAHILCNVAYWYVVRVGTRDLRFRFLRVDEGIDPYGLAHILCVLRIDVL